VPRSRSANPERTPRASPRRVRSGMSGALMAEDDGLVRCPWGLDPPEYRLYHDQEWGRPVGDDDRIFEKLCLEGFQSGLSWLTILRKREGFRRAFAGFDPEVVATFGEGDVERLLSDPSIVRHRAKIQAAIGNARATVRLREQGLSLAAVVWRHEPSERPSPVDSGSLPATTAESKALSSELRRLGFGFVGPTTVYASMQSLGVVNDHVADCVFRPVVESERARFTRPG
jgi:DNA-3-methyladenine glycosylase I